jgi:hypothetical protein
MRKFFPKLDGREPGGGDILSEMRFLYRFTSTDILTHVRRVGGRPDVTDRVGFAARFTRIPSASCAPASGAR